MEHSALDRINEATLLLVNDQPKQALAVYAAIPTNELTYEVLIHKGYVNLKLNDYDQASQDFNQAVTKNADRYEGYYNCGKAAFFQGKHAEAGSWFEKARNHLKDGAQNDTITKQLDLWLSKVQAEIGSKTQPDLNKPQPTAASNTSAVTDSQKIENAAPAKPVGKIKYTWSQTDSRVYVEIQFGLKKKEDFKVKFEPKRLDLSFPIDSSRTYELDLDLCEPVEPSKCRYEIQLEKIEIIMEKKERGTNWKRLEVADTSNEIIAEKKIVQPVQSAQGSTPQSSYNSTPQPIAPREEIQKTFYPSSAKVKKDWSKIDKEIDEDMKANKDEYADEDPLNKLFKEIYGNADENTRRAMIKSFQTSGGTVLSTNWNEVSDKDYEGKDRPPAPAGQEYRKINE